MTPSFIQYSLLFLGARLAAGSYHAALNLTELYGPGLSSGAEIFYASDANFSTEVTPRWTVYSEPTYYGAIKPATEADIQYIVKVSAANHIPFLATGAGHGSSTTLARLKQGIEIDLGNFDSVELDAATNLLTIGGSVVFSGLYDALYGAGKQLPLGNAPCVGVLGATLGGTVGGLQGLWGLGLDSLASVTLITASGELVQASQTENAELFWGLRGAGANFGIVTSAVFNVHDAVNGGNVTSTDFLYPGSANASVWEALKSFDDDIPDALALDFFAVYNSSTTETSILVNAAYFGPASEASQYLTPFLDAGPSATDTVSVPWTQWQEVAFFGEGAALDTTSCTPGQYSNGYAIGLKQTDVPTFVSFFNNITSFWAQNPDVSGTFAVYRYPNAVTLSVPDDATAYPHREIKTHVTFESYYANSTLDDTVNSFIQEARAEFQTTSGFDNLSVYVNFAHGDEGANVWYKPRKLANLTALKNKWDPDQLFGWYNPVPLNI